MDTDSIKYDIEESAPAWLGPVVARVRENGDKKTVEVSVYSQMKDSEWVKIDGRTGRIDVGLALRCDWEFDPVSFEENPEAVKQLLFHQIYVDYADLFLSPTDGESKDPLLHYGDHGSRFLPRDVVRELVRTNVPFFAPKIDMNSSFREEEWYKAWEDAEVRDISVEDLT